MHIAWKKKRKKDKTIDSSRKSKKVRMEPIELSDSEEESDDPSSGSKDGEKICYSHSGNFCLFVHLFAYLIIFILAIDA